MSEPVKKTRGNLPGPGPGRPKGVPNKTTALVREMVTQALDEAGGVSYLVECAKNPRTASAFLSLVGKVLPVQLTGADDGPIQVARIELVALSADSTDSPAS